MGLQDRDYTRYDYNDSGQRRPHRTTGRSAVLTLIFINVALWLANGLLFEGNGLTRLLLLQQEYFWHVDSCYRYLTYGFAHSPGNWMHIAFNMLALLMFGYGLMLGIGPGGFGFVRGENVENRLGRLEFLAFYLLTIIIGGIVFALTNINESRAGCLGASGGVCGVVILYAWLYPGKTLLLWGILPMPMWGIGVLIVFMDAVGASGHAVGGIAYSVHLAGAALGTLYYFLVLRQGIKLTGWLGSTGRPKRKPKIRIHTPEEFDTDPTHEDDFNRQLDAVLKRYGEVGESGLTAAEREFLRRASRKFAEKHGNR